MPSDRTYAGDLTPTEAHRLLASEPGANLVDVRTQAELAYVGLPDLADIGKPVLTVQWQNFPEGELNNTFVAELTAMGLDPDQPVAFLCRSGGRSRAAARAATAAGYTRAYNIAEGFEGDVDPHGHRGRTGGWKFAGLPWKQT